MNILTQNGVINLLESENQFPVDFEDAWRWVNYKKKQNAKEKLVNNFTEGVDYVFTDSRVNPTQQGSCGGRPPESIYLS